MISILPTPKGSTPLPSHVRDSLSTLDILCANTFEDEDIDPNIAWKTESDFYKGAPPQWLNFYWAEKQASPFIKRDGYEEIREQIQKHRQKKWSVTNINLFHQPGSGGSTLAMQVLWDLRKELRCATLTDLALDTKVTAKEVVNLFCLEGTQKQKTVLLLLDNEVIKDTLQQDLIEVIKVSNIFANIPVVILLNCVRNDVAGRDTVMLKKMLSEEEKLKFTEKQAEIVQRHKDKQRLFHAFNIMQSNFNTDYVQKVCADHEPVKIMTRPCKVFAFLSLVNSYVPGSYLLQGQCQDIIGTKDYIHGPLSLEQEMEPFTDLIVTFSIRRGKVKHEEKRVRIAHPMIADECVQLLTRAGVTRSDTTQKFLVYFCRETVPPYLMQIIKKMLTKRENGVDRQDKFSKLIQDIQEKESTGMCIQVLTEASGKFQHDAFFPQALARFYYIEKKNYPRAEHWAKEAIKRDSNNSFIKDTLGQIHKNHLLNRVKDKSNRPHAQEILQLAESAIKAFQDVEEAAENEHGSEMKDDGVTRISNTFNNRGLFGYIQVANNIFYHLTKLSPEWSEVLTKNISADSLFVLFGDRKLNKYKPLVTRLRDEVEKKFEFFESYLTYSKVSIQRDEPPYFRPDVDECYSKYVGSQGPHIMTHTQETMQTSAQMLKKQMANSFPGLLSCLSRAYCDTDLEQITVRWRKIHTNRKHDVNNAQNYILANVILNNQCGTSQVLASLSDLQAILEKFMKDPQTPEFYLLVLLLFWPHAEQDQEATYSLDLNKCVINMRQSFEKTYKKHLRSRYLVPLFFLGPGEGLHRLMHRSKLDQTQINRLTEKDENADITNLLRVKGEVKEHRVFACIADKKIEVFPHHPASVQSRGLISFYLGFNIRGPVAYNIKYMM